MEILTYAFDESFRYKISMYVLMSKNFISQKKFIELKFFLVLNHDGIMCILYQYAVLTY